MTKIPENIGYLHQFKIETVKPGLTKVIDCIKKTNTYLELNF